MDVIGALRRNEAMLDLADRAARLAAARRREMRRAQFHIKSEFGVAVDSLLIGTPIAWTPESMREASER